jgi:hypothetical protein
MLLRPLALRHLPMPLSHSTGVEQTLRLLLVLARTAQIYPQDNGMPEGQMPPLRDGQMPLLAHPNNLLQQEPETQPQEWAHL